jgi:3D (Asp-Asp-Asp) domain-containing protein
VLSMLFIALVSFETTYGFKQKDAQIQMLQTEIINQEQQLQELFYLNDELDKRLQKLEGIVDGLGMFEATAYSRGCGNGDGFTATMTRPQEGRTVAVDPEIIPLGSLVWIEGWGWLVAEDTGGLIKGKIVDIFMENESDALEWGRRKVLVYAQQAPDALECMSDMQTSLSGGGK